MLENFFQLGALPANQMLGTYDFRLVFLSLVVAVLASYIALDIVCRLRDISSKKINVGLWLSGGAFAMGAGIWSMHFIGMLAFVMPMPMHYDIFYTLLSMIVAILASGLALYLLQLKNVKAPVLVFGGIIMGFAIASMHYLGMEAMTQEMRIRYIPWLFALSIFIAIFASEAALWLALKSSSAIISVRLRLKIISAIIMGIAICGMHYTGMAAAVFTPLSHDTIQHAMDPELLAVYVAGVTFIILSIAFAASTYEESRNQKMLLFARQAGMAEVAASVLHNVGNVLNNVVVSANVLSETMKKTRLSELEKLNNLLKEHENDLANFIQNDERGKHFPAFIDTLTRYWKNEQETLLEEANRLTRNINHIKSIIVSQQDLSRVSAAEQIISIENALEEALLISAIEDARYNIQTKKNYERLQPVLVDKVKLLQILVNLFQNAKEALLESKNPDKMLIINLKLNKQFFIIEVIDNGVGITRENFKKIFHYGFTTKKTGHGFGLHSGAIAAKEMGGGLIAESKGKDQGTLFRLELPYRAE
jgi:NO-binding membrane sensor protein with MHYT domain